MIRPWIQRLWAAPVFEDDEAKTHTAGLLNFILLGISGIIAVFALVYLFAFHNPVALLGFGVFLGVYTGALALMRRGYVTVTALTFLTLLWIGLTFLALFSGGVNSHYFVSYVAVILMAGMVLGGRIALTFAGASVMAGYGMYLAELQGRLPASLLPVTPLRTWLTLSANFVMAALLLYLATRSMHRALERARQGEHALAQKALENQQLAHEAQEANEFKSRLIARMSHELRTPLAAIYGLTEMLHYGAWGDLTPDQRDAAQKILQHAQNLEILIAELLQQTQFTLSKVNMNIVSFAPQNLINRARVAFEPLTRSKGLNLTLVVAEDLPIILQGDVIKIEQILTSLLSNAVKFTEVGGVTLRLYRADAAHWAISVSDTGNGIAPAVQARLFEPFRQGDESPTREYGGMGLGLALVKQLTLLMHGAVTVESEVGNGSTFTVTLPFDMQGNGSG